MAASNIGVIQPEMFEQKKRGMGVESANFNLILVESSSLEAGTHQPDGRSLVCWESLTQVSLVCPVPFLHLCSSTSFKRLRTHSQKKKIEIVTKVCCI